MTGVRASADGFHEGMVPEFGYLSAPVPCRLPPSTPYTYRGETVTIACPDKLHTRLFVPPTATTAVVTAAGIIDTATPPRLHRALANAFRRFPSVVLDLSDVSFLGASGLSVIALAARHSRAAGNFQLRNPSRPVRRVLALSGFDRRIPIETSAQSPATPTPSPVEGPRPHPIPGPLLPPAA